MGAKNLWRTRKSETTSKTPKQQENTETLRKLQNDENPKLTRKLQNDRTEPENTEPDLWKQTDRAIK